MMTGEILSMVNIVVQSLRYNMLLYLSVTYITLL